MLPQVRLTLLLSTFLIVSCSDGQLRFSAVGDGADHGDLDVKCAQGRIEVGLKRLIESRPHAQGTIPVQPVPLSSTVLVHDEDRKLIFKATRDRPIVYWMSEKNRGEIEYIALHEIELQSSLRCRDYTIAVDVHNAADILGKNGINGFVYYVREAKRP